MCNLSWGTYIRMELRIKQRNCMRLYQDGMPWRRLLALCPRAWRRSRNGWQKSTLRIQYTSQLFKKETDPTGAVSYHHDKEDE